MRERESGKTFDAGERDEGGSGNTALNRGGGRWAAMASQHREPEGEMRGDEEEGDEGEGKRGKRLTQGREMREGAETPL